jgi:glucosamine-6-phosphate deaminase
MVNLKQTLKGTLLENFYPAGWDFDRIEKCFGAPETVTERQKDWHADFCPVMCGGLSEFEVKMGHEIAVRIKKSADGDYPLAMILPVGPMGMYKWTAYFLNEWGTDCKNLYTFNMDEYAAANGDTVPGTDKRSFEYAMTTQFFALLNKPNPKDRRRFATKRDLPSYGGAIAEIKKNGGKTVLVYGIGRMCHIAFWEPQYAGEFASEEEWSNQAYRLGAKLHPLTVEQNAVTSFKSRTTLVPATANTVGPKLLFSVDYAIGGCDGVFGRGMQWQGTSLWMTLRYGKTPWVPSTYVPAIPGRLFFVKELAGPLEPECN